MTQLGQQNHYNVKFLKGYGFSINVKNNKIVLKNAYDPFKEPFLYQLFYFLQVRFEYLFKYIIRLSPT